MIIWSVSILASPGLHDACSQWLVSSGTAPFLSRGLVCVCVCVRACVCVCVRVCVWDVVLLLVPSPWQLWGTNPPMMVLNTTDESGIAGIWLQPGFRSEPRVPLPCDPGSFPSSVKWGDWLEEYFELKCFLILSCLGPQGEVSGLLQNWQSELVQSPSIPGRE